MQIIPNKETSRPNGVLMRAAPPVTLLISVTVLGVLAAPALAGTFDVKGPEITAGETEIATNHSIQSGFPANADRVRHSYELAAGYSFSDRFKAGIKAAFDTPLHEHTHMSVAGVEAQIFLGQLGPSISWAWFACLDARIHQDDTNTVVFGPLIRFGDDKLSLTLNPLFEHTFGPNRVDGLTFAYAAGLKGELRDGLALGIEAHGAIPELGHGVSANFHAHRIGPVLYIDHELFPAHAGQTARKLSLEIGGFAGMTDATPDWTGKIKAALTW
jgi:hypothetical protein